jgi:prolyl-tRNA synthetase
MSKGITSQQEDYSKWYNDIVVQADLADHSAVRGCMVIKPSGYAIWEKMQQTLDRMFKETLMLISRFLFKRFFLKQKKKTPKVLQRNVR